MKKKSIILAFTALTLLISPNVFADIDERELSEQLDSTILQQQPLIQEIESTGRISQDSDGETIVSSGQMVVSNSKSSVENNQSRPSRRLMAAASGEETVTTVKYHIGEEYHDGNFRFNFYIDSIVGPAPYALDASIVVYTEPSLAGPVTINNTPTISKVGGLTTGLVGSTEIAARTTFWAAGGVYGMESSAGLVQFYPINLGPVVLQNKLAQNFPQYIDVTSGKDAESPIRTDWTRLASSPSWNGRNTYINQYNTTYGTQSDEWWSLRQIHHIQPRIYGGSDDFNNLMPVPILEHRLITTWFANY
ncbi:HNH endonuclease [Streptococcus agalactiae]|nr:HNH endonuclease [Streptococcus agalactiae]